MRSTLSSTRKTGLRRLKVLVTAGPTRERIDPVRFISNYSTGTFGYKIAEAAYRKNHHVTLISGPVCRKSQRGIRVVLVESAREMRAAVLREFKKCDCLIMAAAVSDWRIKEEKKAKIKKNRAAQTLKLVENPDILRESALRKNGRIVVGFALETERLEQNAIQKLKAKSLDLIVANKLTRNKNVFSDNKTSVLIVDKFGGKKYFCNKSKGKLANIILDKALNLNIG